MPCRLHPDPLLEGVRKWLPIRLQSQMNKHILKRRSSKSSRGDLPWERFYHIADELVTTWPLHPQGPIHHCRFTTKALAQLLLQAVRVWGLDHHDVAADT